MSEENKNMKGTYFISSISITSYMVEFGMSSVFILFLLYVLNFSMSLSSTVYAYYYGFAYLLPILIGYISDKYLDRSTSLTLGFIALIISQISLAFAASFYHPGGAVHNFLQRLRPLHEPQDAQSQLDQRGYSRKAERQCYDLYVRSLDSPDRPRRRVRPLADRIP